MSRYPEFKAEVIDALLNSNISGNGNVLAATCTLCIQVTSAARLELLTRLASILTLKHEKVNLFYLVEVSVALIKDGQFSDLDAFFKAVLAALPTEEFEDGTAAVKDEAWRLVNFCLLLSQVCQRKAPSKALFADLCSEYLKDEERLRQGVESALLPVYWPAPKARASANAGGPPPDLMNMLSGLMGSRR